MPLYSYNCRVCKWPDRRLLSPEEAREPQFCRQEGCSGKMKRVPKAPSTHVKETVDNGLMTKRVEIFSDNDEVYKERNEKDYRGITKDKLVK